MMFRRTVDEDESASDWDDLSPRVSPKRSSSPEAESPPPPFGPPKGSITAPPKPLVLEQEPLIVEEKARNTSHNPTLLSLSFKSNGIYEGAQDIQAPPQLTVQMSPTPPSPPRLTLPTIAGNESLRSSGEIELAGLNGTSKGVMYTHYPASSDILSRRETRVLSEEERGSADPIAGVPTPHPPLAGRSRDHRSVYQVRGGSERGGSERRGRGKGEKKIQVEEMSEGAGGGIETNFFEVGGTDEGDVTGHNGNICKKHSRLDLEFNPVSAENADSLPPSHHPPHAYMRGVAIRWEKMSARGVEEVCSTIRLLTDLLLAILLGSAHCIFHHVLRKLLCGLGHIFADSIYKPALTLCFNGFMWPCLSLTVQLSKGFVLVIRPLLEVVGVVFSWVTHVFRAFRLVNLTYKSYQSPQSGLAQTI